MPTMLLGLVALVIVIWALHAIAKANPGKLVRVMKPTGGIAAVGAAVFLGVRGQLALALPLGFFGLSLLGWLPSGPAGFGARTQKTTGQVSRVSTSFVEMELEHDTGAMRGRFVAGPHAGFMLDALDLSALTEVLPQVDEESRALLAAYLDRREPAWRENAEADAAPGRSAPRGSKMTDEEAYQILGVPTGASAEEIGRAHRALMKKLHPDQGGSTYLAARVNEAKDVLLRRHR